MSEYEPTRAVYVFDRSLVRARLDLGMLLLPHLDADAIQQIADLEPGPLLVLSMRQDGWERVGFSDEVRLLQFVRGALALGAQEDSRIQWRVRLELDAKLKAVVAGHARRYKTADVVSGSLQ